MLKEVIKLIFGSIEDDVNQVIEIEKSIKNNKENALELSTELSPVIRKLVFNSKIMDHYCRLQKSEQEKASAFITLDKINEKLDQAKSEYYESIGELRNSNFKLEKKLNKLLKKEEVKKAVDIYKAELSKGGLSEGMTLKDVAKKHKLNVEDLGKEYEKGKIVEKEHTDKEEEAAKIALDHLVEDPKYYTKLATIEKSEDDEEESGKKTLSDSDKEKISGFIKNSKGEIKDDDFHEFVEDLGVNVHYAEQYVYSLVKEHLNIHKSILVELDDFGDDLIKSEDGLLIDPDYFEKAGKDISKLKKKIVTVTRGGKTFQQTVYVSVGGEESTTTPIGGEITPEVKGLNIIQYSDKAIAIKGDTYANLELMRSIKTELGVGKYIGKLKAWLFPASVKEEVLGLIYSDVKNQGEDEKAEAIRNQKNALDNGTDVKVGDIDGKIKEEVSDSDGIKYNIETKDGTKLEGVDEKVLATDPETDDKKIADAQNEASPESRVKVEKKIYGIKPIEDIHNYSLQEYLGMHGLTKEDIDKVISSFKNKVTRGESQKRAKTGGTSKESTKGKIENLTKRQLIGKLVYAHYQAVKKAIADGEEIKPEVIELYDELKSSYSTKRKELTEEHKRKIAEALRKNKVPEETNEQIKKENEEAKEQGGVQDIDKENYKPKDGEDVILKSPSNQSKGEATLKTKDYMDIPALDISIPKPKKILEAAKPYWVPEINMEKFKNNSHSLSAVKLEDDKYLVALGGFMAGRTPYGYSIAGVNKTGDFAIMTLDQYAATQKYYQVRAKEQHKVDMATELEERKSRMVRQLMDNNGKTEEEAKVMIERFKFKQKRLKILSETRMTYDQMHMISAFNFDEEGRSVGNRKVWEIYGEMAGVRRQKEIDIDLNQEYTDSVYTKGAKTSYGDTGTKDTLMKEYGVKVKRQNGDEITKAETEQIKGSLDVTAKLFGNNVQMNKEFGLKISHSGSVHMHARNAIGIFHPFYSAIGVSAMYGDNKFQFTFGHEYAHFMDYWIGKQTGNHYASEKQGSTAQQLAGVFRKNLNEKTKSNYTNRTCECFARALEQYTAIETYGDDVMKFEQPYIEAGDQVNLDVYKNQVKPLIEQFLEENKEFLKSLGIDIEKARSGKYADNSQNRGLNRVGQPYGSKGKEDEKKPKNGAKTEEKQLNKDGIDGQAKKTSGTALEVAAKDSKDTKVRTAAHKEIARRASEEAVKETDGAVKEGEKPKEASGTALETTSIEANDPKTRTDAHKEIDRRSKEEAIQEPEVPGKETKKPEKKAKAAAGSDKKEELTDLTGKWGKAEEVATGQPMKMTFSHNTDKAEVKSKQFAQDIEPHGKYMIQTSGEFQMPGWEYGEIEFQNPLVMEHIATNASGWKGELVNKFGKKGKALSQELIKRGYDAIVTIDSQNNDLNEIVSLKDFDPEHKDKRKMMKSINIEDLTDNQLNEFLKSATREHKDFIINELDKRLEDKRSSE